MTGPVKIGTIAAIDGPPATETEAVRRAIAVDAREARARVAAARRKVTELPSCEVNGTRWGEAKQQLEERLLRIDRELADLGDILGALKS